MRAWRESLSSASEHSVNLNEQQEEVKVTNCWSRVTFDRSLETQTAQLIPDQLPHHPRALLWVESLANASVILLCALLVNGVKLIHANYIIASYLFLKIYLHVSVKPSSLPKLSLCTCLSAAQQDDDVDEKQADEDEGEVDEQLLQVPLGLRVHLDLRRSANGRFGHVLNALHGGRLQFDPLDWEAREFRSGCWGLLL